MLLLAFVAVLLAADEHCCSPLALLDIGVLLVAVGELTAAAAAAAARAAAAWLPPASIKLC